MFHSDCIQEWMETYNKKSCPMCRTNIENIKQKTRNKIKIINCMDKNIFGIISAIKNLTENDITDTNYNIQKMLGSGEHNVEANNLISNIVNDIIFELNNLEGNFNTLDIAKSVADKQKNNVNANAIVNLSRNIINKFAATLT
jgi:hypothetical protein